MKEQKNITINSEDWWELDKIVYQPTGQGTEQAEFAYLVNRYKGQVKKVRIN